MKRLVTLTFNVGPEQYDGFRSMLQRLGCVEGWAKSELLRGLFQHAFDADDQRLHRIRDLLHHEGIVSVESVEHHYAENELRAFPLLALVVTREIKIGGPQYGTEYDLTTGCRECGAGATQCSPLILPRSALPKSGQICKGYRGEVLTSGRLADAIRTAKCVGVELRQASSFPTREPQPWWQLICGYTMPRLGPKTKGIIRGKPEPCPLCQRDGHYMSTTEPMELVYNRGDVDLARLPDCVQTWECFGSSALPAPLPSNGIAQPLILVKQNVFELFRNLKVKRVEFDPVRVD